MSFAPPSDKFSPQKKAILVVEDELKNDLIELLNRGGYEVEESFIDINNELKQLHPESATLVLKDKNEKRDNKVGDPSSELRYHLLFESMVEAFAFHEIILDENGMPIDYIFLEVNPAFERLTGLKKEEIINKRVLEVLPNTEIFWIQTYGNVALTGTEITFENYSAELDKWFAVVAFSPQKGQFATMFLDITERKKSEEILQESEERFRKMFSEHEVPMLLVDPKDDSIVDANSGAANYFGYSVEKLCSMTIGDINALSREEMYQIINQSNQSKSKYLVFPNRLANGEIRMVEVYTTPIVINKNTVIYSIIHDITERVEAENKLNDQLDELQRWHKVTLGRELRIIELKNEVNRLLNSLGQQIKYQSVEESLDE